MRTVLLLLGKDLRRAWRNPVGWLVFLAIPLIVTGLVGAVFGPKSSSNILGRIHFAVVDEDDSGLTRFLRGALNQGKAGEHLDPVFLTRAEALRQVSDNKLSAMLVIPEGFTRNYLATTSRVTLELVKNTAESIRPAVLEELLGAVVTGLDAIKQNFGSELPDWQEVFEGEGDYRRVAELIARAGDKVQAARQMLFPPRVIYTNLSSAGEGASQGAATLARKATVEQAHAFAQAKPAAPGDGRTPGAGSGNAGKSSAPAFNIFAYLLPGMASMFLLFLAENASRDLDREIEQRTLQRFSTLYPRMHAFVASKILFCVVFLLLCSAVLLLGGGLIFQISWKQPLAVAALTAGYCVFAGGLMTLLPVVLGNPSVSQALGNVVAMLIGMAGGSAFPAEQLPAFLRNYVSAWLPNNWYIQAMRAIANGPESADWAMVALKTALIGVVPMLAAALLLQHGLRRGLRQ